jgi:hypothetical protein
LFVFSPLLSSDILGPLRILLQSVPLIIVFAVVTDGYLLDRLHIVEWVMISLSTIFFAAAMFTYNISGIILSTVLGIVTAAVVFILQKKRKKTDKLHLQEQII